MAPFFLVPLQVNAQPMFIYRPEVKKVSLLETGQVKPRGELFASLLLPSNFPSFNDFSGEPDRWNFGFQIYLDLTFSSELLAQLVTHDDGHNRTKFDWHFSFRQHLGPYLVLIAGHDSNHDSDHLSYLNGKPFYLNRNYLGFSLCFRTKNVYFEPFTWFFHHTNQRSYLDLSGEKLKQEYGFRLGFSLSSEVILSWQTIFQTDVLFSKGQMVLVDLILRVSFLSWLELACGGSFWNDLKVSRFGHRQTFYKIMWGVAIPF
ncbi:MAG: hypothetical protein N3B16_08480 [Candidatus Aminicenantes bacterium]|nr:hypothetical protein [Candidatus Aminicenantes bacterium]